MIIIAMRLLFLLIPFFVISQQRIDGIVLDAKSGQPVPYVNVSLLETNIGTSSEESGEFSILIPENDLSKSIQLSSLGYDTIIISVSELLKVKEIRLNPKSELLDEVVLSNRKRPTATEVHPLNKKLIKGGMTTSTNPHKAALFFPFEASYIETPFINKVKFYFDKTKKERQLDVKFRVRVYGVSNEKLPAEDLLKENVVVFLKGKENTIEIDLSTYHVEIPGSGCYIAFEWLHISSNKYIVINKYKKNGKKIEKEVIFYAPRLGMTMEPIGQFISTEYKKGQWEFINDLEDSEVTAIPAISLTLSN